MSESVHEARRRLGMRRDYHRDMKTDVTVNHRFPVPAERVFDAWLDPGQARHFLFTTATGDVVRCDIDARAGGRYAIVDRRNGEDVLHEGTYAEINRPRRLVFTLRVPKYSPDEDRVVVDIEPIAHGCDLRLTTQTPQEWADDTRRGWAMILDVLDQVLPLEAPTCGAGLAQHSVVPRRIAAYLAELAETLELHRAMLVLDRSASNAEDDVYRDLAARFRELAGTVRDTADHMAAQLGLPMGAHDQAKWTGNNMKAFQKFVHEQGALVSVLLVAARRDEEMLASMREKHEQPG